MKRTVAFALLLAAALPALAQTPKWSKYVAKADGFSILMPGPTSVQNQDTQGVKTHIFISMAQPFVCAVSRTVLPSGMKAGEATQMKTAMKTSMLQTARATATGEKTATYSGFSGRQTSFKTANGGAGATWIAQKGNAVYSVTIVKQGGASPVEISRFLGSLSVR